MALFMRAELARPGLQFLSLEQFNQLFTMHGTIMLLFYATPIVFGFANFVLPLQIGAPDVAFPRLNAFSYWLYVFGALIALSGFFTPGGAAAFGWTAYPPLSGIDASPQVGGDLWIMGLAVVRSRHHPRWRQHDHHGDLPARPRHDHVAAADLHLGDPRDVDPGADRLPDPDRGAVRAAGGQTFRLRMSSIPPTAGRSCSNISSGSSAIQRCTSSRCPSSGSSPR